jgi:hypothetical protein
MQAMEGVMVMYKQKEALSVRLVEVYTNWSGHKF